MVTRCVFGQVEYHGSMQGSADSSNGYHSRTGPRHRADSMSSAAQSGAVVDAKGGGGPTGSGSPRRTSSRRGHDTTAVPDGTRLHYPAAAHANTESDFNIFTGEPKAPGPIAHSSHNAEALRRHRLEPATRMAWGPYCDHILFTSVLSIGCFFCCNQPIVSIVLS